MAGVPLPPIDITQNPSADILGDFRGGGTGPFFGNQIDPAFQGPSDLVDTFALGEGRNVQTAIIAGSAATAAIVIAALFLRKR